MDKEKKATSIKVLSDMLKELAESTNAKYATLSYCDDSGWCFSMSVSNTEAHESDD